MDRNDGTPNPPRKHWSEIFGAFTPLVSGVVVVIVGFLLKDSVTLALQREQLQLSHVVEMRDLILDLNDPNLPAPSAEPTALTLAAFGKLAVRPLLSTLDGEAESKTKAAMEGLRSVGFQEPTYVCGELAKALDNRAGLYDWSTHLLVIELLGQLGCSKAIPSLDAHQSLLARSQPPEFAPYAMTVRQREPLDIAGIKKLKARMEECRRLLRQQAELGATPGQEDS